VAIDYSTQALKAAEAVQEPLDDRFNGRIGQETKRLVERAANAVGLTTSAYMVQASRNQALQDLKIVAISKLGAERIAAILAEAEEDDDPNDALVAAARRHRAVWITLTAPERFQIQPFDSKRDRAAFSCGDDELDRYFWQQVGQDVRAKIATCFLCIDTTTNAIAGYYTLNTAGIPLAALTEDEVKRITPYPSFGDTL